MIAPIQFAGFRYYAKPNKQPEVYTQAQVDQNRLEQDVVTVTNEEVRKGRKVFFALVPHDRQPKDYVLACFTNDDEGPHATIAKEFWDEQPAGQIDDKQVMPLFFREQINEIMRRVDGFNLIAGLEEMLGKTEEE